MANSTLYLKSIHDHDEEHGDSTEIMTTVATPSLWGVPIKHISLVTLAIQNSMLTLIMHHSRNIPSDGPQAAGLPWTSKANLSTFRLRKLSKDIFSPDCWKLSIPAILYVVQNNLQYVAASNLDAATFQVTYQMKILTTAAFSVLLLRRKLSPSQWIALLFLAIGVGIVQIQAGEARSLPTVVTATVDVHIMNRLKGFMALTSGCATSSSFSFPSSPALLPALAPLIFSNASTPAAGWCSALFHNFGLWAWATVAVQVFGGLITALVIKYSDNILKGFATSLSIVLSFLASVALFRFQMTFTFGLGSSIVLGATWLYNQPPKRVGLRSRDPSFWSLPRAEKHREEQVRSLFTFYTGRATSTSSTTSSLSTIPTLIVTPPLFDSASEKTLYIR
ncbi:nucleotide-sugar transporter-domain-containing protein [Lyophyllum atratum]|nr:nucleotide-sugar transporter-domain-containing protein [Lyophyllum atratum]